MTVASKTMPIELKWGVINRFEEIYSSVQNCYFLLAYGEDPEDGESIEEAVSVNLPGMHLPSKHHYFIRTDNYNHDLVAEMISRGFLEPTTISAKSGWVTFPVFKFSNVEQTNG